MSNTWDIKGVRDGITVTVATVHELEYHGEWMAEAFVTVTVKSPVPVDFHFGDYLIYRGEKFEVNYDPNVIKKARTITEGGVKHGTYGEAFSYANIKLYAESEGMKTIDFKDVVLNPESAANTQIYTSLSTFSFYAASVEDLADRLQANLNRDSAAWTVFTPNRERTYQRVDSHVPSTEWSRYYDTSATIGETDVNVDVTDADKCWQVLRFAYEKFGLSYFVKGRTIVIGGKPVIADHIFRYGKGNGLYEIERTSDENQEIVTKLFAYGSEQNLPLNYYANIGKKVKFTISRKSVKTYIAGHPTMYLWVESAEYTKALENAFSPNYEVTLTCGSYSARFKVSGSDTVYYDDKDMEKLTKVCLYFFWIDYGEQDEKDFFDNVPVGSVVYVTGVNINKMPEQYIEIPAEYSYPALLSINRLMLPGFPDQSLDEWVLSKTEDPQWEAIYNKYTFSKDAHDPWIASSNLPTIGLLEGTVNYDGSQQKEIYPTIENTGAGVVVEGSAITDNGFVTDPATFTIHVANADLNWKEALSEALEEVKISMTSGYCTGRDFKVNKAEKPTDKNYWVLTLERSQDTSLSRWFPYYESGESGYCQIRANDTFAVLGIQMPDSYIQAAAEKLFIAACGYLDKRDHMRYTYLPKIDEIYMQRQDDYIKSGASDQTERYGTESYHDTLFAGMQLQFEDAADLGIERLSTAAPFIDQLTIKENGNNGIPTYDTVLRDEKEKSTFEKLTERISELQNPVIAPTERQTRQLQYVEYSEWVSGHSYYNETLNPETNVLETSYVWHKGKKWMCLRSLTTEEPGLGCQDWKVVEGDQTFALRFYASDGTPYGTYIQSRRTNISIVIAARVFWGIEEITSKITSWLWVRLLSNGQVDESWSGTHTSRTITLTNEDMPPGWSSVNPARFECRAFCNDGTEDLEISAEVNFS